MKKSALGILAMLLALGLGMVWTASADDIYWQGINNVDGTAADTDINSPALWSGGAVPGSGDMAHLLWNQTDTAEWGNLAVNGAFAPDHLVISATASTHPFNSSNAQLQLDKNLTLQTLTLNFGYLTGAGDGNLRVNTGNRLTLTGSHPLYFGGHRGAWASMSLQADATLEFSGSSYTFDEYNTNYAHSWNKAQGFRPMGGLNGYVDFTGVGATVTLGDLSTYSQRYPPNNLVPPAMDLGNHALRVRSDQTWQNSASGTGLVRAMVARDALIPSANHNILVTSLDGTLPDLSNVPFRIQRSDTLGNASSYRIPGASYQSLEIWNSGHNWTHGSQTYFTGDVTLAGGTLVTNMDGTYATGVSQTEYGLAIWNNARATRVYFNQNSVTMARGMLIRTDSQTNYSDITRIDVTGATLDIGGDLVIQAGAGASGAGDSRRIGFYGDADTEITLRGAFTSNARSPSDGNGLSLSTMNLLGGSAGMPNTFEVAADPSDGIEGGTYAIGVLNVGTADGAGHVRLVNEFLNDGLALDSEENRIKDFEILLAGTLTIGPESSLDLDGQGVRVETALWIDETGLLDLNTGLTLTEGDIVYSFMGVGDQTATWDLFAGRVIDSSNPDFTFVATTNDPNTYWQAIPEPGSVALLALGALALLARRRRRG